VDATARTAADATLRQLLRGALRAAASPDGARARGGAANTEWAARLAAFAAAVHGDGAALLAAALPPLLGEFARATAALKDGGARARAVEAALGVMAALVAAAGPGVSPDAPLAPWEEEEVLGGGAARSTAEAAEGEEEGSALAARVTLASAVAVLSAAAKEAGVTGSGRWVAADGPALVALPNTSLHVH
jgi:hypothetical protein